MLGKRYGAEIWHRISAQLFLQVLINAIKLEHRAIVETVANTKNAFIKEKLSLLSIFKGVYFVFYFLHTKKSFKMLVHDQIMKDLSVTN